MKGDLENQYQEWQEKINSRNVNYGDINNARIEKLLIENDINKYKGHLNLLMLTDDERVKQEIKLLTKELDKFQVQLNEKYQHFVNFVNSIVNEHKGLTPQRIQQFEQFTADESFVGDQCVICMEEIDIDRNMMRLDCDGQHTFCQVCIEKWFDNHKTCPTCRHAF